VVAVESYQPCAGAAERHAELRYFLDRPTWEVQRGITNTKQYGLESFGHKGQRGEKKKHKRVQGKQKKTNTGTQKGGNKRGSNRGWGGTKEIGPKTERGSNKTHPKQNNTHKPRPEPGKNLGNKQTNHWRNRTRLHVGSAAGFRQIYPGGAARVHRGGRGVGWGVGGGAGGGARHTNIRSSDDQCPPKASRNSERSSFQRLEFEAATRAPRKPE